MSRGENTTTPQTVRRVTPPEWGMAQSKREIVEGKYVLMERVIHWWGSQVKGGVRQLEEGTQQVFMHPDMVAKKEKQGWYRVEDDFDLQEALRKEERLLDADNREIKRKPGRPAKAKAVEE